MHKMLKGYINILIILYISIATRIVARFTTKCRVDDHGLSRQICRMDNLVLLTLHNSCYQNSLLTGIKH